MRAAVAERFTRRGLATVPEQILVTSGAQHALTLVIGLLCEPGDRVMVENPSYPNALEAMRPNCSYERSRARPGGSAGRACGSPVGPGRRPPGRAQITGQSSKSWATVTFLTRS
ncbi:aminotransferase class I/II-fold pyridoxal phosphate-dependent enzyme [Nonomuraea sp. NPDC050451]|uniref:aminotransferase class I/II-fold pyridoxal phosphate-dependent enzyme n=1 Tax=Nonomuraea sp. NPDC050451 TaxID=3364364 RepID=UPI003791CE29